MARVFYNSIMKKEETASKMESFKPLKWEHYEKLDPKAKEIYNKQERDYNFDRKMKKKYGNSVQKGTDKLNKFFS